MTVDSSIPLGFQQPNGVAMLGNLVSTATAMQQYQQQQIQTQVAQQNNQERIIVQNALQNKDPDLTPGVDGLVDPAKATSKLMQLAPNSWQMYTDKINQNNYNMTAARQAALNLNQNAGKAIGDFLYAGDWSRPSALADQLDELRGTVGTAGKPLIDEIQTDIRKVSNSGVLSPEGQTAALAKLKGTWTGWYRDVQNQQDVLTQTYGGYQSGGTEYLYGTKPGIPGQPQGTPTAPNAQYPVGIPPSVQTNQFGQQYIFGPAGGGQAQPSQQSGQGVKPPAIGAPITAPARPTASPVSPAAAKGGVVVPPPISINPDNVTVGNVKNYTARWQATQASNADPITGYQNSLQMFKNLYQLLQSNPKLGPGAPAWNQITGLLAPFGANANSSYQQVVGYLDNLGAARASSTGATTNLGRQQSEGAIGSPTYVHDALQEKLRFNAAANEAAGMYAAASSAFSRKYGNSGAAYGQQFDASWTENADPVALRLLADKKIGDTADYNATMKQVTPRTQLHLHNLMILKSGDIPSGQ